MNMWLFLILSIIVAHYLLEVSINLLTIRSLPSKLPEELGGLYSDSEYSQSKAYVKACCQLSLVRDNITTSATILFIVFGGFRLVDDWARAFSLSEIFTGLIFAGTLLSLSFLLNIPFSLYSTFVIEDRFGFNTTTIRTYISDLVKGILLTTFLGGVLFSIIQWFFINAGPYAWLYCWLAVVVFSIILQFLAPILIMPLFNKFSPLEDGPLKETLTQYAKDEQFQLQGIFTMDGSKRSTKLNAFFTGFGRFRKIVIFDTLVEKLTNNEILAVLAHEMGHFKLKHIPKMIAGSILQTGIMLYLLSLVLDFSELSVAFGLDNQSVYSSLFFFGFLYSPINTLISIFFNYYSRKHEFAADEYSARSTGSAIELSSSLKKLSRANLAHLTPHPLRVFIHYSHPPLVERLRRLEEMKQSIVLDQNAH